jgi:heptose I phosphotransferase
VKSRRTFRVEIGGKGFFIKHHLGIGWREIFKDLLQFKKPVTGARGEYEAIRHLEKQNVPTMACAGFGERFFNPAARESFIITRELAGMVSLEDLWARETVSPALRREIICRLGRSVGRMHASGLNHRDCYICHFLRSPETGELHVIDLHRAQIRKKVPFRYAVKDVAGILFSALDLSLTYRDIALFYREYKKAGNRNSAAFRKAVWKTAHKLYFKEHGKTAPPVTK